MAARRERRWFDRWVLARRDFARLLTLLVALRAIEVARIAWAARPPGSETLPVLGLAMRSVSARGRSAW